jgi:hypothetical protein
MAKEKEKPVFKHQKDINTHAPQNCPPSDAIPKSILAFRFVCDPITNQDFMTQINLGNLPRRTEEMHDSCKRCGLSMFLTIESAKYKYSVVPNKSRFQYTHLAKGELIESDGVCSDATNGHFTFYEYANSAVWSKFSIVSQLG